MDKIRVSVHSEMFCTVWSCILDIHYDKNLLLSLKFIFFLSFQANVEGIKCTICKGGTFGLGTSPDLGCQNCVCMGITSECSAGDVKLNSVSL